MISHGAPFNMKTKTILKNMRKPDLEILAWMKCRIFKAILVVQNFGEFLKSNAALWSSNYSEITHPPGY